ncbi:uncharacterized protein LODBEIA_P26670 [Lodderomyces beijingensis]|uniref:Trafficking protein particle complex II-specific subunit 65 IgD3 domain-containing protein n=1 Tax=Lodderomyces beijingensis TaxID=1775926 RepID=A0ABP0ZJW7_9ASCO
MQLKIVVPKRQHADKASILKEPENVENRDLVFFDERLEAYVIASNVASDSSLTLRARISSSEKMAVKSDSNGYYTDAFASWDLQEKAVVAEENNTKMWEIEVPIAYPRTQLKDPYLILECESVQPASKTEKAVQHPADEVLKNFMPASERDNHQNRSKEGAEVVRSENVPRDEAVSIVASVNFPIVPALVMKMKSTKPAGRNDMLLAAINIECSEDLRSATEGDVHVEIVDLTASFELGQAEPVRVPPKRMSSNDSLNSIYKFTINDHTSRDLYKRVSICLKARIQKLSGEQQYQDITNTIQTEWAPYLDFGLAAPPINHALRTNYQSSVDSQNNLPHAPMLRQKAINHSIYKAKGANGSSAFSTNNLVSGNPITRRIRSSATRQPSAVTISLSGNVNSSLTGLRLTFIGKLEIGLGQVMNWKIQAINDSPHRLNLSLIVRDPVNLDLAYAADSQTNAAKSYREEAGIIFLNNDIRIGPMDPHSVFETGMELVGNKRGVFNLDGLKIFDINTGDGLDIGKLLEVFVV